MPVVDASGGASGSGMGRSRDWGLRDLSHLVPLVVDALILPLFSLHLHQLLHRHIIFPIVTAPRHGASLALTSSVTKSVTKVSLALSASASYSHSVGASAGATHTLRGSTTTSAQVLWVRAALSRPGSNGSVSERVCPLVPAVAGMDGVPLRVQPGPCL